MSYEMTREQWEKQMLAWWDGNEMDDYFEDPPPEALWDAFETLSDLVKIIKREQKNEE